MQSDVRFIFIVCFILLLSVTLIAGSKAESGTGAGTIAPGSRTAIIEDQAAGIIRFVIDGQEVAQLDSHGLHVRENIEFGGILTDAGTAYYDRRTVPEAAP